MDQTLFGIWNAFSAGVPEKMFTLGTKGTAGDWVSLAAEGVVNIGTLGFHGAIKSSIQESQSDLLDWHFQTFGDTAGRFAELHYRAAGTLFGIGAGITSNVYNLLPIDEIGILLSPDARSADKWGAGFFAISKTASIAAMGAAVKNTNPIYGETSKMGFGWAGPKPGHAGVTFGKFFFDKVFDGPLNRIFGTFKGRLRAMATNPETFDRAGTRKFEYSEVEVPRALRNRAHETANRLYNDSALNGGSYYHEVLANCGDLVGKIFDKAGVSIIAKHPAVANWMIKNVPFLGGTLIKAAFSTQAVQSAEAKK